MKFSNQNKVAYIHESPVDILYWISKCCIALDMLHSYQSSIRADDLGSIYDKKTFTVTQMKFELFNTLPNRSLALLLAGPDLGDKIYKQGL